MSHHRVNSTWAFSLPWTWGLMPLSYLLLCARLVLSFWRQPWALLSQRKGQRIQIEVQLVLKKREACNCDSYPYCSLKHSHVFRTAVSFSCGTVGIFGNAWHDDEGGVWFSDVCRLRDTTKWVLFLMKFWGNSSWGAYPHSTWFAQGASSQGISPVVATLSRRR